MPMVSTHLCTFSTSDIGEGVLHGNLGLSLRFNQSVTSLIAERYPFTLQLTLAALFEQNG